MDARSPRRWLLPLGAAVLLGAAVVGLSQAQPQPPPSAAGPEPAPVGVVPPASIDDVLSAPAAGAEEAPPLATAEEGPASAPPKTVVDVTKDKEKPAESTPLPAKAPAPPARIRRTEAILQTLDKVTAETIRFPAAVGKPVRWKDLVFTVRACEEPAADDDERGAFAHIEVYSQPQAAAGRAAPPVRTVFKGWMFSEAPAVHTFEHPVYDAWLIACRTA